MADNEPIEVRRSIEVAADPDEVWHAVVDEDERSQWWGGPSELRPDAGSTASFTDPDGTTRRGVVDSVQPGRHLAWTWWDENGEASRVTIDVSPSTIGTRIDVVETLLGSITAAPADHRASQVGAVAAAGVLSSRSVGSAQRWLSSRLLELEHLFLLRSTSALVA